jgi:predicted Zn-ribbon and HTH transcriptional regulator
MSRANLLPHQLGWMNQLNPNATKLNVCRSCQHEWRAVAPMSRCPKCFSVRVSHPSVQS